MTPLGSVTFFIRFSVYRDLFENKKNVEKKEISFLTNKKKSLNVFTIQMISHFEMWPSFASSRNNNKWNVRLREMGTKIAIPYCNNSLHIFPPYFIPPSINVCSFQSLRFDIFLLKSYVFLWIPIVMVPVDSGRIPGPRPRAQKFIWIHRHAHHRRKTMQIHKDFEHHLPKPNEFTRIRTLLKCATSYKGENV